MGGTAHASFGRRSDSGPIHGAIFTTTPNGGIVSNGLAGATFQACRTADRFGGLALGMRT